MTEAGDDALLFLSDSISGVGFDAPWDNDSIWDNDRKLLNGRRGSRLVFDDFEV